MKAYRAIVTTPKSDASDLRPLSEKLLLGGVLAHHSTPFELRSDAEAFAASVVRGNLAAGRRVGEVRIKEVNVNESCVIRHAEIA